MEGKRILAVNNAAWEWATYRDEPEGVKINLEKAVLSQVFPNEAYVRFVIGGKLYDGWMPDYSVNIEQKWLKAFIIADDKAGQWLIYMPDETLTSGRRLFVPLEDQNTVVAPGWW